MSANVKEQPVKQAGIEVDSVTSEAQKSCYANADMKARLVIKDWESFLNNRLDYADRIGPDVNVEGETQELANLITEDTEGMYDTVESAQKAGQKALDFAVFYLGKHSGVFNDASRDKKRLLVQEFFLIISRFFESLMNDPSLNADLRAQAERAYNTLIRELLSFYWRDSTSEDDKWGALTIQDLEIQDLEKGFSLIEDLSIVRKRCNLNTVGIILDKDALRVLMYRMTSRLRIEAINQDYMLGVVGVDEDDLDPTDCYLRFFTGGE